MRLNRANSYAMSARILITGASGFIGKALSKMLIERGYLVTALLRSQSDFRIPKLNILTKEQLINDSSLIKSFDAVIHLATCYMRAGESEQQLRESNIDWPLDLLELSLKANLKVFINSDTFYPPERDLYSASKREFLERALKLTAGSTLRFINLRLQHVYGIGDSKGKFIPYLIDQFKSSVKSIDLTGAEQQRDFTYLEDVLNAYLIVLEHALSSSDFVNPFLTDLGSAKLIRLSEMIELLRNLSGAKTKLNYGSVPYLNAEIFKPVVNVEPLLKLGFKAKWSLEAGLRAILED
jgi:CDP-paratose synthetase